MTDPTHRGTPPESPGAPPADLTGKVRAWWDADAATYDQSSDHGWAVASPAQRAAGKAALHRRQPGRGSRGQDAGAGTRFQ